MIKHPAVDSRTLLIDTRQHKMHSLDLWQTWPENQYSHHIMEQGRSWKEHYHNIYWKLSEPFLFCLLNFHLWWSPDAVVPHNGITAQFELKVIFPSQVYTWSSFLTAADPLDYTACAASDNVLVQLWHVGHLVTKLSVHLWSKTCIQWIQGHHMLKDSTQNHLKPHKTQLAFPVCPWLNFSEGPERVLCHSPI